MMILHTNNQQYNWAFMSRCWITPHPDGTGGLVVLMHGEQKPMLIVQRANVDKLKAVLKDIADAIDAGEAILWLDITSPTPELTGDGDKDGLGS